MLIRYIASLIFRVLVLLLILWAYIKQPHYFDIIVTKTTQLQMEVQGFELSEIKRIWENQYSIIWVYAVWALFMGQMLFRMFRANSIFSMGGKKVFKYHYQPVEGYDELKLYKELSKSNVRAYTVLLVWLFFNAIFGVLYIFDFIQIKELVLLTAFYYVCDNVCIVIWCPFQRFIVKNRCCVNCRIFNWGYLMMFTPFLFIRNFFTWSIFFMSLVLVLRWEITLQLHPERFWDGSNEVLKCENCTDKICTIKGRKIFDDEGNFIKTTGRIGNHNE